jgi:hypothetical protein
MKETREQTHAPTAMRHKIVSGTMTTRQPERRDLVLWHVVMFLVGFGVTMTVAPVALVLWMKERVRK